MRLSRSVGDGPSAEEDFHRTSSDQLIIWCGTVRQSEACYFTWIVVVLRSLGPDIWSLSLQWRQRVQALALIMERDESVPHMSASLWEVCLWKLKQLPETETDSFSVFTQSQISPKKKIFKNILLSARPHLYFQIYHLSCVKSSISAGPCNI